ncbi:MAG: hypothetical protein EZS28_003768 [Streblomastix strix]|uniref:Uncharacterized protein n=1 Tax=Streblomastix strix TaxID=222440 RepID=A0A5J4X2M9_9EUKA|nr:MAG: hypothetical protein EZS28_003768 [Streblomastix strix]
MSRIPPPTKFAPQKIITFQPQQDEQNAVQVQNPALLNMLLSDVNIENEQQISPPHISSVAEKSKKSQVPLKLHKNPDHTSYAKLQLKALVYYGIEADDAQIDEETKRITNLEEKEQEKKLGHKRLKLQMTIQM